MSAMLITYDLHSPGQNYEAVHEKIKELGEWWHFLESTWIVVTTKTASAVWDHLAGACDKNDSFLIVNITSDSYSGWLPQAAWDWLRKHV
jgi:hypothetical protein